jgi:hypothetical protein
MSEQPPPPGSGPGPPPPGSVGPGAFDPAPAPSAGSYTPSDAGPRAWPPPAPYAPVGRPLHKPGTIPLRPLTLADFFDGAFATIRRNPRSTIGMGALVTAAFMMVPLVASVLFAAAGGLSGGLAGSGSSSSSAGMSFGDVGVVAASGVSGVFSLLANVVVAGLMVPVVTRAALGEYIPASAAWRQARGSLLRLVGLAVLELLVAVLVVGVPVGLAIGVGVLAGSVGLAIGLGILLGILGAVSALAVHVRWFQLAAPSLVVEKRGVFASLARASRLSRGSFWRILGIFLLMSIATYVVSQVIGVPFAILGAVLAAAFPDAGGLLGLLLSSNVSTIISGAVVAPFTGAIAVLQYLDMRFRKEGFDIDLITHVQGRGTGGPTGR